MTQPLRIAAALVLASIIFGGCANQSATQSTTGPLDPGAAALEASRSSLIYEGTELGPRLNSQSIELRYDGDAPVAWTATTTVDWLTVVPDQGTLNDTEASVRLLVDHKDLVASGTAYLGEVTITPDSNDVAPLDIIVSLTLNPKACRELTGLQLDDITLTAGCYDVTGDVIIDRSTVTVRPCTTLIFAEGAGLTVRDAGVLNAVGTVAEPIRMTAAVAERGHWDGIRFLEAQSPDNRLEHVTIEYGGGTYNANLFLDGSLNRPSRVSITDCTIQHSATYGILLDNNVIIDAFNDNVLTLNAAGPGSTDVEAVTWLDGSSMYTGNDIDRFEIHSSFFENDQVWPALDVPYLISNPVKVLGSLTIEPGATFVMSANSELLIEGAGELIAAGRFDSPIVFGAADPTPGFWGGVRISDSLSTQNRLDYVTIEYAGGRGDGSLVLDGSVARPAQAEVNNSTFKYSATYGVYLDSDAVVNEDIETANSFDANVDGKVRFP